MPTRMASRPKRVRVEYRGLPYWLDLVICRRALVNRQVEGGIDSMESLAGACQISRSTASRFFSGRPTSLDVTLRILAALGLRFEQVATPIEDEDDSDHQGADESQGESRQGAHRKLTPRRSPPDLSLRRDRGFAQ